MQKNKNADETLSYQEVTIRQDEPAPGNEIPVPNVPQKMIKILEIHSFFLQFEGEWALMSVQTSDWKSDFNCKGF